MNAEMQYKISAADLEMLLALERGGTLAEAGVRLGVDTSTVFRALKRVERGLGQRLFERSRAGYTPLELTAVLVRHAETLEAEVERARSAAQTQPETVAGTVRITTADTVLHGLVAPALRTLREEHPLLDFELHTGNELANLTRRDADIALRATRQPPPHLVGKTVGVIRAALFGSARCPAQDLEAVRQNQAAWIAPDDALPDHPSVLWRNKHFPKRVPTYRVNSIHSVMELIAQGLGVGIVPLFLARQRPELVQLTAPLEECETELWLLTHPESRHLRRVATVYAHLGAQLALGA